MPQAELPPNEPERLDELRRLGILDSGPERAYDDLTLLATQICGTPIALITLIDEGRQWFKSRIGMDRSETLRDQAFCAHAIHESSTMVVPDALSDHRGGLNLGTLCVIDTQPRELTGNQKAALEALARQVVRNLRQRQFDYLVRSFLENAPLFFALKDHEGRYEFVSSAWRAALRPYGDPLGKTRSGSSSMRDAWRASGCLRPPSLTSSTTC